MNKTSYKYALSLIDHMCNTIAIKSSSDTRENLRGPARSILETHSGNWGKELEERLTLTMDRPDKVLVDGRELLVSETAFLHRLRDEMGYEIL